MRPIVSIYEATDVLRVAMLDAKEETTRACSRLRELPVVRMRRELGEDSGSLGTAALGDVVEMDCFRLQLGSMSRSGQ